MSKPTFHWNGKTDKDYGGAYYTVGSFNSRLCLNSLDTALCVQKLIDSAYAEGKNDEKLDLCRKVKSMIGAKE